MADITDEQMGRVVDSVMPRHSIVVNDEQRSRIVWELQWIRSARDNFERATQIEARDEHQRRLHRIDALESVVTAYDDLRQRSEQHQTNDLQALSSGKKDVATTLCELRALLEAERDLAALPETHNLNQRPTLKHRPTPNHRPTSNKHVGTTQIFKVLRGLSIDAGKSASVIADLLIAAGIEDHPRDKLRRSLRDKLSRI